MKQYFALIILGSASLLSADQYHQWENPNPDLRNRPSQQAYYQGNDQYNQGRPYRQNRPYYQMDNQPYGQNQPQNFNTDANKPIDGNQKIITDQEITKNIHDALASGPFSRGFQNISYDVRNGNVRIKGYANSTENRNKIEETIGAIDGVKYVDNQIFLDRTSPTAPANQSTNKKNNATGPVSDQALIKNIQEQLSSGWFTKGFDKVSVTVNYGVVDLDGTVDSPNDKDKVGDTVKKINGVKLVNNRITVTGTGTGAEKTNATTENQKPVAPVEVKPAPVAAPAKETADADLKDEQPTKITIEAGVHHDDDEDSQEKSKDKTPTDEGK